MSLPIIALREKTEVADGTMAFYFDKPDGFDYTAGQFAEFTLTDPPETDEEGNSRAFTLSSAPFEPHLSLTTRLRDSAFKRVLVNAKPGTEMTLDGPFGSFTLHNNVARPAVFLTGGIGITPARSIVAQASHDNSDHTVVVFYSNKTPKDAAYLQELTTLAESNANFTFVPTMDHMDQVDASQQSWSGQTGVIDKDMLERHVDDLSAPIYYLCGPPAMVTAMRSLLNDSGVDGDDIRTEEFPGY